MATFAGIDLGFASEVYDVPNPLRWQFDSFPGVNGRLRTNMGSDGGTVEVLCDVQAMSAADMLAFEQQLYARQRSGIAYPLLGNMGEEYGAVVLEKIERVSKLKGGGTDVHRKLRLTFGYDT